MLFSGVDSKNKISFMAKLKKERYAFCLWGPFLEIKHRSTHPPPGESQSVQPPPPTKIQELHIQKDTGRCSFLLRGKCTPPLPRSESQICGGAQPLSALPHRCARRSRSRRSGGEASCVATSPASGTGIGLGFKAWPTQPGGGGTWPKVAGHARLQRSQAPQKRAVLGCRPRSQAAADQAGAAPPPQGGGEGCLPGRPRAAL